MRRDLPSACAILVAHDSQELLPGAVEGLRRHAGEMELKIVVVDCGSADRSVEVARGLGVDEVVEAPNLGYGAGNNLGARTETARGCEWLVFVNPDAHPVAGDLASLLEAARQAGASVAAPRLMLPDGSAVPLVARGEPVMPPRPGEAAVPFESCSGAFFAQVRSEFEALDGFDERFFMCADELDLLRRSHQSGALQIVAPLLEVVHRRGSPGEEERSAEMEAQAITAWLVYSLKWGGRAGLAIARARVLARLTVDRRLRSGRPEVWKSRLKGALRRVPRDPAEQRRLQAQAFGPEAE